MIDLRPGDWADVLADVTEVDSIVVDPPYSARVHDGHDDGAALANKKGRVKRNGHAAEPAKPRRSISYSSWSAADVDAFVDAWAPRNRGWFVAMSDSELCAAYRSAFERHGLTGFQPVPLVIPGMTVRMCGDGPSSWAVYLNVARPKSLCKWGTLPGAYICSVGIQERAAAAVAGAKPLRAMREIVGHYSRPGDLICDPCAGGATTLVAAKMEGRRGIGAEVDPKTFEIGRANVLGLSRPSEHQPGLFG